MKRPILSLLLALALVLVPGCSRGEAPAQGEPPLPEQGQGGLFRDWSGHDTATRLFPGDSLLGWTLTDIVEVPDIPIAGQEDHPESLRAVFQGEVRVRGLLIQDSGRGWYRQTVRFLPGEDQPLPRWAYCGPGAALSLLPAQVIPEQTKDGYYNIRDLRPMEYFQAAEEALGLAPDNRYMDCELLLTRWEVGLTEEPGVLTSVAFATEVIPLRQEKEGGVFTRPDGLPAFLREGEALGGWTLEELVLSQDGTEERALFTGEATLAGGLYFRRTQGEKTKVILGVQAKGRGNLPEWYECPYYWLELLPDRETMPEDTRTYNRELEEFFGTARQRADREYLYTLTAARLEARRHSRGDSSASDGTLYLSRVEVTDQDPTMGVFTNCCKTVEPQVVRMGEQFLGWTLTNVTGRLHPTQWQGITYDGVSAIFEGELTLRGRMTYVDSDYPAPFFAFFPEDASRLPMWEDGGSWIFPYPDWEWPGNEEYQNQLGLSQVGDSYLCEVTITRFECVRDGKGLLHNNAYLQTLPRRFAP